MIKLTNLIKTYPSGTKALCGIDLHIKKKDFYALLGPNGAGKTTTINIITSLIRKTSGTVVINGHNLDTHPSEAKQSLGVVPQEFNFNIFETCLQIVVHQAGYYGIPESVAKPRALKLFDQLGLAEKANMKSMTLSGGMKRRLMIARALIHKPKVLILDEPTAGVDISLRRTMWDFLVDQNKKGLTIVLTTHYLEEAENLCNRIAIIDKGTIIRDTTKSKLLATLNTESFLLYVDDIPKKLPSSKQFPITKVDDHTLEVQLTPEKTISEVTKMLEKHKIVVNRIKPKSNRLEELFLNLTGS